MAPRHKRLWTDEEKRSICLQTMAAGVSVAQVARRYAMNTNLIFKWLRDPRFAPAATEPEAPPAEGARFLPVEIIDAANSPVDDAGGDEAVGAGGLRADGGGVQHSGVLEIELPVGYRLRVMGAYDAEALALLIRRLSA